jgi:hypothetical protein
MVAHRFSRGPASAALEFFVDFDGAGVANGRACRSCRFNSAPALSTPALLLRLSLL